MQANAKHAFGGVNLKYSYQQLFDINLKGVYNNWNVDDIGAAYGKPEMELTAGVTVRPISQVTASLDYYLATGRKAFLGIPEGEKMEKHQRTQPHRHLHPERHLRAVPETEQRPVPEIRTLLRLSAAKFQRDDRGKHQFLILIFIRTACRHSRQAVFVYREAGMKHARLFSNKNIPA